MGKWNIPYPRQAFVDEYRRGVDRILAEVEACKKRMLPQWKMLRSFKNLKFADTWKGNERERKVEKRSKKVREKYETFLQYGEETQYNKILRELISDLRDEDEPNEWRRISRKHIEELNRLRGDMQLAYYDFLEELKELITFIKEQKQEEMKEMDALQDDIQDSKPLVKEMTEMATIDREKVVERLCDKYMFGEITEAQRDAALEKLNTHMMYEMGSESGILAAIITTVSAFVGLKIGSGIQKSKCKKLIKYYETTYPDKVKVKIDDLDMKKISIEKAVEYSKNGTLKKMMKFDPKLSGKMTIVTYNDKPFALIGEYFLGSPSNSDYNKDSYEGSVIGSWNQYYEPLSSVAKSNDEYYRSAITMLSYGKITPEIKKFWEKYLKEMKDVEKKMKKEGKATKESVGFNYTDHREEIIQTLYEKCESGEITLEQREAAIQRLNFYCEGETVAPSTKVCDAVEDYLMEESTAEELDLVLESIYEESPETEALFTTSDIDDRYEIVLNTIGELKESGEMSQEELKTLATILESGYMTELEHRISPFFGSEEDMELMESAVNDGTDRYYEIMDSYCLLKESVDELLENGELTEEEAQIEYEKLAVGAYQQFYEYIEDVITWELLGLIKRAIVLTTSLIVTPINAAIKSAKGKKVIRAYETINAGKISVKMSDLTIRKMDLRYGAGKYYPELAKVLDADSSIKGKCFVALRSERPFAICGSFYSTVKIQGENSYTTKTTPRVFYKSLCPEAKKHEEFYRSALVLCKVNRITPEIKDFARDFLKQLKALEKEEKKKEALEKKKAKAQAKADKVAKEYVESTEDDVLYEKVISKIQTLYENGGIDLEKREELLMEAKHHFYFV